MCFSSENTEGFLNNQLAVKTTFVNNETVKNEVYNSALTTKEDDKGQNCLKKFYVGPRNVGSHQFEHRLK